jgi:hypothetical protein
MVIQLIVEEDEISLKNQKKGLYQPEIGQVREDLLDRLLRVLGLLPAGDDELP